MADVSPPLGLLAELTYRCPLHCAYCSNPVNLAAYRDELNTEQWADVFTQARELGVLQLHLSGGEPLARPDLRELVEHAHGLGLYLNLVTAALSLTEAAAAALAAAGLDHVQISVQDADPVSANAIAGGRGHDRKLAAAAAVKRLGLPLTANVVLHRGNLDRIAEIIDLAEAMGADRLELANTQYYGWGLLNRDVLMPSRQQLDHAQRVAAAARERLAEKMTIVYIVADYHADRPKPCMNGWGSRQLTVSPNGDVLPCPVAAVIDDLNPENVVRSSLKQIWYESESFNRFRGTAWMPEPCQSCPQKEIDFGGCRCQAYQLTGDAAATDPVCGLSPNRELVDAALAAAADARPAPAQWATRIIPRRMPRAGTVGE
jgi:pyrroloquinoline quinone biosynthesis protein E